MSLVIRGTEDTSTDPIPVTVGDWSLLLIGGAIRVIRWRGVEIVRGIDCPIRDPEWVTLLPEQVEVSWDDVGQARRLTRRFTVGNGALAGHLVVTIDPVGTIDFALELHATAEFRTMRSGFTVLHPIAGVAGRPVRVRQSAGTTLETHFPEAISPSQPVFDIVGLTHEVAGIHVELTFDGEIFEMEDQRNWIDASYKTYCRPLARPRPYPIMAGETVRQTIHLAAHGTPADAVINRGATATVGRRFPELLLALDEGWMPDPDGTHPALAIGLDHALLRIHARATGAEAWVGDVGRYAGTVDLEVVIPAGADPVAHLTGVATQLRGHGIDPRRVIALPEAYLRSYQPTEAWPTGTSPTEAAHAAQVVFPKAMIGVGMLTHFTELNRCRPGDFGDYVTHSTTAIVHAADDLSVFETLEALPRVVADTIGFAGGSDGARSRTVRMGLQSIGTRSNAYGGTPPANPHRLRRTVAQEDPRQIGLIAGAYAVGVAAAVASAGGDAFALSSLAGPFGVASAEARFPIFFAVQALGRMVGHPLAAMPDLPTGVCGVAVTRPDGRVEGVIANTTAVTQAVIGASVTTVRCLDEGVAPIAAGQADWLDASPVTTLAVGDAVHLGPYAILFASWD